VFLYHGSNAVIGNIDLSKSRDRTDFGKGFYLSDKIGTAQRWAIRKTELSGGIPTIIQYEIDKGLFEINGKRFPNLPDVEWLNFICFNRRRKSADAQKKEPKHDYNWVSGSIADDDIADVVDDYIMGDIDEAETIFRARALPQTYQASLHTLNAINFVNELNVYYKQLKKGRWSTKWIKR